MLTLIKIYCISNINWLALQSAIAYYNLDQ